MRRATLPAVLLLAQLLPRPAGALSSDCENLPDPVAAIAAIDLDGDGDIDIAAATANGVLVVDNTGQGILRLLYADAAGDDDDSAGSPASPARIAAGQSIVDLAAVPRPGGAVELVTLAADGRLSSFSVAPDQGWLQTWTTTGSPATAMAWADVDGDGAMDVALARATSLDVLRGQGDALVPLDSATAIGPVTDVAFARGADGRLGLAAGGEDAGRVYTVDAEGLTLLGSAPGLSPRAAWADLTGDGRPAAYFGRSLTALEPDGDGVLDRTLPFDEDALSYTPLIAVAPEGALIVAGDDFPMLSRLREGLDAEGSPAWTVDGEALRSVAAADLLVAELVPGVLSGVVAGSGTALDGGGVFVCVAPLGGLDPRTEQRLPNPQDVGYATTLAAGDIDGDGLTELVVADSRQIVILSSAERGAVPQVERARYVIEGDPNVPPWVGSILLEDLDGDGQLELLVALAGTTYPFPAEAEPAVMILKLVDGALERVWEAERSVGMVVSAADVDGDGWLDLALGTDSGLTVRRGCGGGVICFDDPWSPSTDFATTALAWGDVDGDRDLDLALHSNQDGLYILQNDSTPGALDLTIRDVFPTNDSGSTVHWVDWNRDGALDLLESRSSGILLHRNIDGALEPVWISPESMAAGPAIPMDWDRDGDPDLVVLSSSGELSVYAQEDEGPQFAPSTRVVLRTGGSGGVRAVDADGDGELDLLWTTWQQDMGLLRSPQLDAGLPSRRPRVAAWIAPGESADAPVDERPITVSMLLMDAESDPVASVALEFSVLGDGAWVRALEVTGDLADLATSPEGVEAAIEWDWVREGVPAAHPSRFDHPIDTDRLALRVVATAAAPQTVAGPQVVRPEGHTLVAPIRRWPDSDNDGTPDRWDPCHDDPNDDSDGDESCDSVDLCVGVDSEGDADRDGVCADLDCLDSDPLVRPGAAELCLDGLDNNCDEVTDLDDPACRGALIATGCWCDHGRPIEHPASFLVVLAGAIALRRRRYQQALG